MSLHLISPRASASPTSTVPDKRPHSGSSSRLQQSTGPYDGGVTRKTRHDEVTPALPGSGPAEAWKRAFAGRAWVRPTDTPGPKSKA